VGSAILSVATAVPGHRLEAGEALEHLRRYWPQLGKLAEPEAAIGTRYLCEPVADLLRPRRLEAHRESYLIHARELAVEAARRALARAAVDASEIDVVITVSCTGYLVPSLDVYMSEDLGFRPDITRLPITELGCSAGAAAVAAAHRHLVGFPEQRVLVVAVELPSLNFHPGDGSLDNLTACLVFGDGAGAAVIGRPPPDVARLEVLRTASHLIPRTAHVLGFDLRDAGFHVVLDRRLPRILERELPSAVARFLSAGGLEKPAFYAVHAAGPRIFDSIQSALGLHAGALDASRQVFAEVGNTSSAAIFFTLEKLFGGEDPQPAEGLGVGIGPGVSMEFMHLARVPASHRAEPSDSPDEAAPARSRAPDSPDYPGCAGNLDEEAAALHDSPAVDGDRRVRGESVDV
jgi:predicted naringenin-chalcone synthase